jgi:glutathione S-transferase
MSAVAAVLVLVLIEYLGMGIMVGRGRVKYNVPAPAISGNPIWERYYRVHQNTAEQLVIFIPALFVFGVYVSARGAAAVGVLFILARIFYAMGYINDPEKRTGGALATLIINLTLLIGGLIGALRHAL